MNEAFETLPREKQMRIINAAMEVFACNEYKRASTDDIAAKAGISKGLLFYYFHNKEALYLYVYEYCRRITTEQILDTHYYELDDYFEILEYSACKKAKMISEIPWLMDFAVRAFYSEQDKIKQSNNNVINNIMIYFQNINRDKFREGVDINELTRMFLWMTDGYMNEKRRLGLPIKQEEIMTDFRKWMDMFRRITYKEEYLPENHD